MRIEEKSQKISLFDLRCCEDLDDFRVQRILDGNPFWYDQFFSEGYFEKPWGIQGYLFLRGFPYEYFVSNKFNPPKIGYAVIDGRKTGFPVSQNRHLHLKNDELVIVWSKTEGSIIFENNGKKIPINSNFGICYIPSGIPHNFIFYESSITVDLKRLVFGHREDNLRIDEKNSQNSSECFVCSSCLFNDKVYSIPWFVTDKIPQEETLKKIQKEEFLPDWISWQAVIFYPERMLERPTDFCSFYEIVSLNDLYEKGKDYFNRFYLFFPWIKLI